MDQKEGTSSITERTFFFFFREDTADNTHAARQIDQTGTYTGSSIAGQPVSANARAWWQEAGDR